MESISQSVWVALLLVEVLICLLLMILIRNKTLKPVGLMFFFLLGSGFSLALSSDLCRVVQSSS
jgi:hypothetical protein